MFIKHEDTLKCPTLISINYNQNKIRIFFTSSTIICYICKLTEHATQSCKKNMNFGFCNIQHILTKSNQITFKLTQKYHTFPSKTFHDSERLNFFQLCCSHYKKPRRKNNIKTSLQREPFNTK